MTPRGQHSTPPHIAQLAHKYLLAACSQKAASNQLYDSHNWWDMCCGRGTLLLPCPLKKTGKVFASTIGSCDVAAIRASGSQDRVEAFMFDFLDQADSELPPSLITRLQPKRKWIFMLNPPFASSSAWRGADQPRPAFNPIREQMQRCGLQSGSANLTCQFLWRIQRMAEQYDLDLTVGVFSQASILVGEGFAAWRDQWKQQFGFLNGFCFHSKEFAGVKGDWACAFTVWKRGGEHRDLELDLYRDGDIQGRTQFRVPEKPLNLWVNRPRNTEPALPLSTATTVSSKQKQISHLIAPGALGFAASAGNDVRNNRYSCLLSSTAVHGAGWSITPENWEQTVVCVAARALIRSEWHNDHYQYSVPDVRHPGYEQFVTDASVWLIASANNQSASTLATYQGQEFDVRNHFFWFSPTIMLRIPGLPGEIHEQLVDAKIPYFVKWLRGRTINSDSAWLLNYLRKLTERTMPKRVQSDPSLQLTRWDAGLYQIRKGLRGGKFDLAHERRLKTVGDRLREQIYTLGMLPRPITNGQHKRDGDDE